VYFVIGQSDYFAVFFCLFLFFGRWAGGGGGGGGPYDGSAPHLHVGYSRNKCTCTPMVSEIHVNIV